MLDLETFGLRPGSVIRSIGAVFFDFQGNLGPEFYSNIDRKSCLDRGLTLDAETVLWWSEQSPQAREVLQSKTMPIMDVAGGFAYWFKSNGGERVWAQGASFDPVLWEAAVGRVPWKFYNVRDTRTFYDMMGLDTKTVTREGTYHNALDDAKHQVACIARAMGMK